MRTVSKVISGLGLALLVVATPAAGQESPRSSVYFQVGLGYGSLGVDCPDCGSLFDERVTGLSGILGLGYTVNDFLVLALEGQGWVKNDDVLNRRLAAGNLVGLFYPITNLGLYFKGGLGYLRGVVETADLSIAAVGHGMSWTAGMGFDIYLGPTVALTPYASYLGSFNTSTTVNDIGIDTNLNPNLWQFGGALTIP